MLKLPNVLGKHSPDLLKRILKDEIENLASGALPLESGLTQGGHIDDNNITATVLSLSDHESLINTKVGIFFTEIVGGCNCNDDPVEVNAYCEIIISINKTTAEADMTVLPG